MRLRVRPRRDTDRAHGGGEETRLSTSCYHLYEDGYLVESENGKQHMMTLSSGESSSTLLNMAVLQVFLGRLRLPWASIGSSQRSQTPLCGVCRRLGCVRLTSETCSVTLRVATRGSRRWESRGEALDGPSARTIRGSGNRVRLNEVRHCEGECEIDTL